MPNGTGGVTVTNRVFPQVRSRKDQLALGGAYLTGAYGNYGNGKVTITLLP
jgi:hypothetical protein